MREPSRIDGTLLGRGGRWGACDLPGGGRYGSESVDDALERGPASGHWATGVGLDIAILTCPSPPRGACRVPDEGSGNGDMIPLVELPPACSLALRTGPPDPVGWPALLPF